MKNITFNRALEENGNMAAVCSPCYEDMQNSLLLWFNDTFILSLSISLCLCHLFFFFFLWKILYLHLYLNESIHVKVAFKKPEKTMNA